MTKLAQRVKGLRIAQEACHSDQQVADQRVGPGRVGAHALRQIWGESFVPFQLFPALEAPQQRALCGPQSTSKTRAAPSSGAWPAWRSSTVVRVRLVAASTWASGRRRQSCSTRPMRCGSTGQLGVAGTQSAAWGMLGKARTGRALRQIQAASVATWPAPRQPSCPPPDSTMAAIPLPAGERFEDIVDAVPHRLAAAQGVTTMRGSP